MRSLKDLEIKGLIFDLDGTLFDSERAYAIALASVGIPTGHLPYGAARTAVKSRLHAGHVSSHNRVLYFKALLEAEGRYTPEATLDLLERYEDSLRVTIRNEWTDLKRAELFRALVPSYRIVLLTNENTRTQLLKLTTIDPRAEFFPLVITSEEYGEEKPSRRLLENALARLELKAEECLMVGDSLEADILPALEAGLAAAWSSEFHPENRDQACPNGAFRLSRLDLLRSELRR